MSAQENTQKSAHATSAQFDDADLQKAVQEAADAGKTVVIENKSAGEQNATPEAVLVDIALLGDKVSQKEIVAKINEIVARVNELSARKVAPSQPAGRDRGPVSEKTMTDDDARRIMLGDLSAKSHKDAATELKLSYGQVYSARKGFTFKEIYKEATKAGKKW